MKTTFKHTVEWSDWSEHSPSHTGQLPSAVILPDGVRVDMSKEARYEAITPPAAWVAQALS